MHPKRWCRRRSVPASIRSIEKVNIPGSLVDPKHLLPFGSRQLVTVPVITHTIIIELFSPRLRPAFVIAGEHWQPDDVRSQTIIGNVLEHALHVCESVSALRADRREECN